MSNARNDMLVLLGKRIQTIRKSKGLTQQELGEKAQLNYKHIGEIERGVQNPSLALLQNIAEGLEIELVDLFLFDYKAIGRDKTIKGIDKILKSLPDETLNQVLFVLKSLYTAK